MFSLNQMTYFNLQFFKNHWPKILSVILFISLFVAYVNIFAVFTPGQTLDPNCAPGTVGCIVSSQEVLVSGTNIKTINGNSILGSGDYTVSGAMNYPSAGIAVSTGPGGWGTSIVDNSTNWNTAFSQTRQWDGGSTGLVAATGRTSLGLGTAALNNVGDFVAYRTFGTAANSNVGDFVAYRTFGTAANSAIGDFAAALVANQNYVTNAELTVLGNTSGINTGDETNTTIKTKLGGATTSTDGYLTTTDWNTFNGKQATLVSGTSIKTINGITLLGSGDIAIAGAGGDVTGPASSTNNNVAFFNGVTGKVIKDSGITLSGSNTGDNAVNTLYSGLVSNATHTGDATGSTALTVVALNGTNLAGLGTGILKNTTGTGVPSIAVAGDFPTLNQSTSGSAATLTNPRTIAGVSFDGSTNISIASTNLSDTANIARLNAANSFSLINPITMLAESWIGPSSTAGIYFKGGNVGIGNNNPGELFSLGAAGVMRGILSLAGNTSGKLIIQPAADAGNYTLTLPGTPGTNGFYLKTDGTGNLSWGDLTYTNANAMPNTVGGLAAGSTFSGQTVQNMFDRLLYPYIAPAISLSTSPSTGTVREFGNNVASTTLNATTTKRSNNITLVDFYRNGSLIHTQASPIAGGGLETYVDTTPVTTNGVTFTSRAGD